MLSISKGRFAGLVFMFVFAWILWMVLLAFERLVDTFYDRCRLSLKKNEIDRQSNRFFSDSRSFRIVSYRIVSTTDVTAPGIYLDPTSELAYRIFTIQEHEGKSIRMFFDLMQLQ